MNKMNTDCTEEKPKRTREQHWQKINYLTQASPRDHNSKAYNDNIPTNHATACSIESSVFLLVFSEESEV